MWLLQKSENPVDKTGFGLDWSGPFMLYYFGLNRLVTATAIILNNPVPHCDYQTLHIHSDNPAHCI